MTVLDIACGTGLNFPYLLEAVGDRGEVIAVDIAPGMLERATPNGCSPVKGCRQRPRGRLSVVQTLLALSSKSGS